MAAMHFPAAFRNQLLDYRLFRLSIPGHTCRGMVQVHIKTMVFITARGNAIPPHHLAMGPVLSQSYTASPTATFKIR